MFEVRWMDVAGNAKTDEVDAKKMTVENGVLLLTRDGNLVAAYSATTNWAARERMTASV